MPRPTAGATGRFLFQLRDALARFGELLLQAGHAPGQLLAFKTGSWLRFFHGVSTVAIVAEPGNIESQPGQIHPAEGCFGQFLS